MYKYLITGGSGFIGLNLIESLIKHSENIILNIDRNKPALQNHLSFWKEMDILNLQELTATIKDFDPDVIIHLAAVTDLAGTDISYYETNTIGTQNIISASKTLPSLKKVIFTSSMYVCEPGFIPPDFDTYKPHTVYGESKVIGEQLVKEITNANFEWAIIRPTSIWGPWFKIPYIDFFKIVYNKKYFDFGKACTKTYGYIGNTVVQIQKLVLAADVHGKTFYLGDKPPIQISEWANEISLTMGKGQIRKIPFLLLQIAAFFGDIFHTLKLRFPITRFRLKNMTTDNVLPLDPIYEITGPLDISRKQGVKETVNWMLTENQLI